LGPEYYSKFHPNSHIFDKIIDSFLGTQIFDPKERERYLELGAGQGKLRKVNEFRKCRLFLSDISATMLENAQRESTGNEIVFVICSAFRLPFQDESFSGVYSFLGDPYGLRQCFEEARRVLKPYGRMLYVTPSAVWGRTLRAEIGFDMDTTIFKKSDGSYLPAPSFLYDQRELTELFFEVGFSSSEVTELYLPKDFPPSELTSHILIPSQKLGIDPYKLPILDAFWVRK
jgi:ubiquinone/menaquinone biosynthesis C-methylase UbiE